MAGPPPRAAAAVLLVLTASCAASPRAATTADPIPAAPAERELARRLDVPFAPVEYPSATKMLASSGEWDIVFTAIDPGRSKVVFTDAYVLALNHHIVPTDSKFDTNADVDSVSVRIAALRGQTNDLFLTRSLKATTLVRADSRDATLALYSLGQADVFSGTRDGESDYITRAPANRILPENFLDVPTPSRSRRSAPPAWSSLPPFCAR